MLGADFHGTVVSDNWCGYNVLRGKRGVSWIHINRHLQAVEVAYGIEPRGGRSLAPPKHLGAGHPPTRFLTLADGLRAQLQETVDWSVKAPASATTERSRQAAVYEAQVRALCDPDASNEDVGWVSRNLVKRMPHLFEFVRDARIPRHSNAGERAIRSICVKTPGKSVALWRDPFTGCGLESTAPDFPFGPPYGRACCEDWAPLSGERFWDRVIDDADTCRGAWTCGNTLPFAGGLETTISTEQGGR